jgi:hypothetical protein
MVIITEFYARYESTVAESELRAAGENLLKFAENTAREYYAERYDQLGITLTVRVEIGSTRVWITIKGLGKVLLIYAAIREGVDYFIADSQMMARLLVPGIPSALNIPPQYPQYHARRLGLPGQLRRLFEKVQRGELSPAEATSEAIDMFQQQDPKALSEFPDLKDRLSSEFTAILRFVPSIPDEARIYQTKKPVESGGVPKRAPSPRRTREPVIAPVPGTSYRRRRRAGLVAARDVETGDIKIIRY